MEKSFCFAVVGDTQRTLWVERLFLGREQNDLERNQIMAAIAGEHPSFLVHLGDLVDWGASKRSWEYFKRILKPVREAKVPVFPIFGNHDYFGFQKSASRDHFYEAFPDLKKSHWYAKETENLGLIFLDTNRKEIGEVLWLQQIEWLKQKLSDFEAREKIRGVLIFGHHPAYTNSRVTGDEACVNEFLTPIIRKSFKVLAYLSGHAHGYEHFLMNHQHFIVSGGGGGPRVTYLLEKKARHADLFKVPAPRPFHYLLVTENQTGLTIQVKEPSLHLIDQITIPYAINSAGQ